MIERYKDDKNTYFFDMGDGTDMIVSQTRDARFRASMTNPRYLSEDRPVDMQIEDYCDLLAPIHQRILGICSSNHHDEILKRTGTDPTRRICYLLWRGAEAERRFLAWENFYAIRFEHAGKGRKTTTLSWYLSHGVQTGSRTEGGHLTSIGNVAINYGNCDIFCFGHNHQLETWDRIQLVPDYRGKKVLSKKLVRINTGSYQKSRSNDHTVSYPESKSMKPNAIGHVEVEITINRNGVDIVPIKRMIL